MRVKWKPYLKIQFVAKKSDILVNLIEDWIFDSMLAADAADC